MRIINYLVEIQKWKVLEAWIGEAATFVQGLNW